MPINIKDLQGTGFSQLRDTSLDDVEQNSGIIGDIGTALNMGATVHIPNAIAGLVDIVNPTDVSVAQTIGDWGLDERARRLQAEYSPATREALDNVRQAREASEARGDSLGGQVVSTLGAYAANPLAAGIGIVETLPEVLMPGGAAVKVGKVARGAVAARRVSDKIAKGAYSPRYTITDKRKADLIRRSANSKEAVQAGERAFTFTRHAGEGAFMAGHASNAITDYNAEHPETRGANEGTAMAIPVGILGGATSYAIGRTPLGDVESAIFKRSADHVPFTPAAKNVVAPAGKFATLKAAAGEGGEEILQTIPETGLTNVATEQPWDKGLGYDATEAAIMGSAMGGALHTANNMPQHYAAARERLAKARSAIGDRIGFAATQDRPPVEPAKPAVSVAEEAGGIDPSAMAGQQSQAEVTRAAIKAKATELAKQKAEQAAAEEAERQRVEEEKARQKQEAAQRVADNMGYARKVFDVSDDVKKPFTDEDAATIRDIDSATQDKWSDADGAPVGLVSHVAQVVNTAGDLAGAKGKERISNAVMLGIAKKVAESGDVSDEAILKELDKERARAVRGNANQTAQDAFDIAARGFSGEDMAAYKQAIDTQREEERLRIEQEKTNRKQKIADEKAKNKAKREAAVAKRKADKEAEQAKKKAEREARRAGKSETAAQNNKGVVNKDALSESSREWANKTIEAYKNSHGGQLPTEQEFQHSINEALNKQEFPMDGVSKASYYKDKLGYKFREEPKQEEPKAAVAPGSVGKPVEAVKEEKAETKQAVETPAVEETKPAVVAAEVGKDKLPSKNNSKSKSKAKPKAEQQLNLDFGDSAEQQTATKAKVTVPTTKTVVKPTKVVKEEVAHKQAELDISPVVAKEEKTDAAEQKKEEQPEKPLKKYDAKEFAELAQESSKATRKRKPTAEEFLGYVKQAKAAGILEDSAPEDIDFYKENGFVFHLEKLAKKSDDTDKHDNSAADKVANSKYEEGSFDSTSNDSDSYSRKGAKSSELAAIADNDSLQVLNSAGSSAVNIAAGSNGYDVVARGRAALREAARAGGKKGEAYISNKEEISDEEWETLAVAVNTPRGEKLLKALQKSVLSELDSIKNDTDSLGTVFTEYMDVLDKLGITDISEDPVVNKLTELSHRISNKNIAKSRANSKQTSEEKEEGDTSEEQKVSEDGFDSVETAVNAVDDRAVKAIKEANLKRIAPRKAINAGIRALKKGLSAAGLLSDVSDLPGITANVLEGKAKPTTTEELAKIRGHLHTSEGSKLLTKMRAAIVAASKELTPEGAAEVAKSYMALLAALNQDIKPTDNVISNLMKISKGEAVTNGSSAGGVKLSVKQDTRKDIKLSYANNPRTGKMDIKLSIAWHGSPHIFEVFLTDMIGTGEGAQVHGWGLYFALNFGVARRYRKNLTDKRYYDLSTYNGKPLSDPENSYLVTLLAEYIGNDKQWDGTTELDQDIIDSVIASYSDALQEIKLGLDELRNSPDGVTREELASIEKSIKKHQKFIAAAKSFDASKFVPASEGLSTGGIYMVDIPGADVMLREDAPFVRQPEYVKERLLKLQKKISDFHITDEEIKHIANEVVNKPENQDIVNKIVSKSEKLDKNKLIELLSSDMLSSSRIFLAPRVKHVYRGIEYFVDVLGMSRDDAIAARDAFSKLLVLARDSALDIKNPIYGSRVTQYLHIVNLKKGKDIYRDLVSIYGSPKAASLALLDVGIQGISYSGLIDGECAVVFDQNAVKILNFMSKAKSGATAQEVQHALADDKELGAVYDALVSNGVLEVVQSISDLPNHIQDQLNAGSSYVNVKQTDEGHVQGLYDPKTNKAYIVADGVKPADARSVLLHEVGVHARYSAAPTEVEAQMQEALDVVNSGVAAGDTVALTVKHRLLAAGVITSIDEPIPTSAMEECNAYLVEEADKADKRSAIRKWWDKFVLSLKRVLRNLGIDAKLSNNDFVEIAKANVRAMARSTGARNTAVSDATTLKLSVSAGESLKSKAVNKAAEARRKLSLSNIKNPQIRAAAETLGNALYNFSLGALFTEDLKDIGQKHLPRIKQWYELVRKTSAARNHWQSTAVEISHAYQKLDKKTQDRVNKYLARATLSEVWGYYEPEAFKTRDDYMKYLMKLSDAQLDAHEELQAEFGKLPLAAQNVIKSVFRRGIAARRMKADLLLQSTKKKYDDVISRAKTVEQLEKLEKERDEHINHITSMIGDFSRPYAPIRRFGTHAVVLRSKEYIDIRKAIDEEHDRRAAGGEVEEEDKLYLKGLKEELYKMERDENHYRVEFHESYGKARMRERELQRDGVEVQAFARNEFSQSMVPAWAKLEQVMLSARREQEEMHLSGNTRKALDAIENMATYMYIEALSDDNARKRELHRRGVAGYNENMMENFLQSTRSEANLFAHLKYGSQARQTLIDMDSDVRGSKDRASAADIFNEVIRRHNVMMEDDTPKAVNAILRTTSMYMLMLNPMYYVQNLTQPLMMTAPYLAGKFGSKAFGRITTTMKDVALRMNNDLELKSLKGYVTDEEYAVLEEIRDNGRIDVGMSMDFGDLDGGNVLTRVSDKLGGYARRVEAINRIASFLAAYRLAREGGMDSEAAKLYADKALQVTHGDYSASNAPRYFRMNSVAKVVSQFRKFQLIQIGMLARMVKDGFAGASKEERDVARAQLGYILGVYSLSAGALGTPIVSTALWLFAKALGEDGEDEEDTVRRLIDNKDVSDVLLRGLPRMIGVDLSEKLGAGSIFTPLRQWEYSAREGSDNWARLVTDAAGPWATMGERLMTAASQFSSGNIWKGIETMMPNGIPRNALQVPRLFNEGYTNKAGDVLIKPENYDVVDAISQLMGLQPAEITDRHRVQGSVIRSDEARSKEYTALAKQYREAARDGDTKEMRKLRAKWAEANKKWRERGYKTRSITDLVNEPMNQRNRERNATGGVLTTDSNRRAIEGLLAR